MLQVRQTQFYRAETDEYRGRSGNCFRACLASLLDLPDIDSLPPFEDSKVHWFLKVQEWLKDTWSVRIRAYPPLQPPMGYAIATGYAARGVLHATVSLDGTVVWDPHPDSTGITSVRSFYSLEPV